MSTATAVTKLAKPRLRGLLRRNFNTHLLISVALGSVFSTIWYFTVVGPRKQRYAEFYRKYDPQADFERMRKLGLFQSCPVDK